MRWIRFALISFLELADTFKKQQPCLWGLVSAALELPNAPLGLAETCLDLEGCGKETASVYTK